MNHRPLAFGIIALVCWASQTADGKSYSFTKIADTADVFSAFTIIGTPNSGLPTINAAGTVAFWATADAGGSGIYVGADTLTGIALTTMASTGGLYSSFGRGLPAINDLGEVAFSVGLTAGGGALHRVGPATFGFALVAGGPNGFSGWSDWPAISPSSGQVGFHGSRVITVPFSTPGIWRGAGGEPTTIATGASTIYSGQGVSINAYHQVAWVGVYGGVTGIHVGSGGSVATWVNTSGMFSGFGAVCAINSPAACIACGPPAVKIAFLAHLDAGGSGIYTVESTDLGFVVTPIATATSIGIFENPSLNAHGTAAFRRVFSGPSAPDLGIFTGPDLVRDRVVVDGDIINGQTVTDVRCSKQAINDRGNIAFRAYFADGSSGIYRANLCAADIAVNHMVDVDDLLAVINAWGPCADPSSCPADIAPVGGNDMVNVDDLLDVINAWGACP